MQKRKHYAWKNAGKSIAILLPILILALFLSYYFYTGPFVYYDDTSYIFYAHEMAIGTYQPGFSPYSIELLTDASLALSFLLFGYGPLQAALPSLLEYLATIVVVFLLGRKMFNEYFAGIASFLFATAPFVVGYITRALPDMFSGLSVAIAIYFLYDAIKLNSKRSFFLSGFFAAFTALVKTAGFIIVFIYLILLPLLFDKKLRKGTKYLAVGILLPILAMLLYFFATTHNPIYNLYVYSKAFINCSPVTFTENLQAFNVAINPILLVTADSNQTFNGQLYPHLYPLGIIVFLAIIGSILGMVKKNRFIFFLFLIFIIPLLYMFFGTKSLSHYIPIAVVSRYIELIAAPIVMLATYALYELYRSVYNASKLAAWSMILVILGFAMLTNIFVYKIFYNYDLGIRSYNIAYPYILKHIPAGMNRVFFASTLPDLDTQYLEFLSGFKMNLSTLSAPCNTLDNNAFLINSMTNFNINQQEALVHNWLGNNCTASLIASSTIPTGPSLFTRVELYKIESK